jgi:hypothetical protein
MRDVVKPRPGETCLGSGTGNVPSDPAELLLQLVFRALQPV